MRRLWAVLLVVVLALLVPGGARAQGPACPEPVARLVAAQGLVELERGPAIRPVSLDDVLCRGDVIRIGPRGRAALALADGGVVRLDQNTTCRIGEARDRTLLDLVVGAVHFLSRTTRALEVSTPFVNAGVQGTEFVLRVLPDRALLTVYEGRVRLENPFGQLLVEGGQAAEAEEGQAPVLIRLLVRPRDAVQWALYYPPVLTPLAAPAQAAGLPPALAEAVAAVDRGDLAAAFERLEAVPEAERGAAYHTLRAGLLLSVGRAEEAREDIDRALALQPGDAEALALGAVIAVAQNDTGRATTLARRAVGVDPGSAAATLALSYALQARFELVEARGVLREAVERQPGDPLLRARLAELELAFGEVGKAQRAAEAAVELGPELSRAHTVLGFVELARLDIDAAEEALGRAIELEPDAPLPHLGAGLALIRRNDLEEGRRQIEIAAGLDPNDALLRSYLGKAFFEERRDEEAAQALATAQDLDPRDPTAFFYDAIREQLENRPVEALFDLERAVELNENRAVYRSRLLLEEDLAARAASLARIYENLGFNQLAVTEAAASLSLNPASFSAHRFLADAYAELPRHEIARVSELLKAQLLQPLVAAPVPPRLAVADLNIVAGGGPEEVGFFEFTPLFLRERPQLLVTGLLGNNGTWGDEVVLSGLFRRFAYSIGQFHSDTDGFRPNNGIENTLYNVFGQVQLTPELHIQAELRRRDTDQGDLDLNFDPAIFSPDERRESRGDVARVGMRFSPLPRSTFLFSTIYSELEERLFDVSTDNLGNRFPRDEKLEDEGYQIELQHLFSGERYTAVAGIGVLRTDVTITDLLDEDAPPFILESDQENAYIYNTIAFPRSVHWTLGLGIVSFKQDSLQINEIEPKLGAAWDVTDNIRFRAAFFETVKRPFVVDQTVEPTEIAGFNQFFDGADGTSWTRFGAGIDARIAERLFAGVELSRRDIDFPLLFDGVLIEERREDLLRGYVYWAPTLRWALTAEIDLERFTSDPIDPAVPVELETLSVPVGVRYFTPRGFFAGFQGTYLHQNLERLQLEGIPSFPDGKENVLLFDLTVGYRLPRRRGVVSLDLRNILDQEFFYQDDNFRVPPLTTPGPRYAPDRTILARMTLNF